ncbi:inositol monophosphatase [Gigaspora margarita]|uniref:Inositol-1-monophosphatase n=1 Tax=Gigaspora margarita TaxID=4874 RepID=A0A8H4A1T6_GIGMA|nr:inositol monophosphatase [Gigaspora margarita]
MDSAEYLEFATKLAQQCGQIILEASKTRYTTGNKVYKKFGQQTDLVTETDIKVEELIKSKLKENFPDHMFIGEETKAAGNHYEFTDKPTWIIDPVDGTTNFVQGFPFVAVSIGLYINKEPTVGVVFNPFLNELFTARKGHGAFLNHKTRLPLTHPYTPPVLPSNLSQCLVGYSCSGVDRSDLTMSKKVTSVHNLLRLPGEVSWSSKKAGSVHGIRNIGCATMNICYVAKSCLDIHLSIGSWEWDVAAALVILIESGGIMVNGHGFDEGPVDIFGRTYLSVRGGSPCDGDENSKQSQLRLIKEILDVVEKIDCPRF